MISFGKNIQNRRIALGLDVSELTQLANYPNKSYIERIEDEKIYPSTKKLPDLAKALSWKIDDLFKDVELEEIETEYSLTKNAIKFIKSLDKKEISLKAITLSLDAYKKAYISLFEKYVRENFLNKVKEMILKTYYNNNPNLEKIEELFEEKEYEICLVGVIKILENIVKDKVQKKEGIKSEIEDTLKVEKTEEKAENIDIEDEDYLRI
ncbi:hypothetical protein KST26_02990 [Fusobacterium animalis]|uniref:helix-turn-helix domain-containing protein n=1 Tax=Fusobacterium animalis TaxID=76859 RepID=UPI001C6F0BB3|nr:hypothetical protein [Fusobacterium animalis]QYR63716.1 hypothetical protein JY398_00700 [Fusobacterium animalis]